MFFFAEYRCEKRKLWARLVWGRTTDDERPEAHARFHQADGQVRALRSAHHTCAGGTPARRLPSFPARQGAQRRLCQLRDDAVPLQHLPDQYADRRRRARAASEPGHTRGLHTLRAVGARRPKHRRGELGRGGAQPETSGCDSGERKESVPRGRISASQEPRSWTPSTVVLAATGANGSLCGSRERAVLSEVRSRGWPDAPKSSRRRLQLLRWRLLDGLPGLRI